MKPTTHVHIRCENVGKPDETLRFDGPSIDCLKEIVKWAMTTTMAHSMRITISRRPVHEGGKTSDFMAEFDSLLEEFKDGD